MTSQPVLASPAAALCVSHHPPPRPRNAPSGATRARSRWNFAEWFVLSQTFFPALLYLPGSQPFRVPIRIAAYGISLAALAYWLSVRRRAPKWHTFHPAVPWLVASIAYLAIMMFHPTTNTLLAGFAQVMLYLSVMAPIFWVPYFVNDPVRLRRLLLITLICSGVNSFVGVMQVRDPSVWMPRELTSVLLHSEAGLESVAYQGPNGNLIVRPPGLGDYPGAVCGPASFALYLGLVIAVSERAWWKKALAVVFASLGAEAIFLTLVRSSFLITLGMVFIYFVVQLLRKQVRRSLALLIIAFIAVNLAFQQSFKTGGESVMKRFQTILADNPIDFYNENRGNQVAAGFSELLPRYPLGAGLGRWGMMCGYFGDPASKDAPMIWVEIQWPAWIVDGGIVLLLLYPIATLVVMWQTARWALGHRDARCRELASVVLAANAGLLALCFSFPVFVSPVGIQFWFLAGAIYGVADRYRLVSRNGAPAGRSAAGHVSVETYRLTVD